MNTPTQPREARPSQWLAPLEPAWAFRPLLLACIALFCGVFATGPVANAAVLAPTFSSASDVGLTSNGYSTAGNTLGTITLNFAPPAGTNLTLVNNTSLDFIDGTFSNLTQGQPVTLNYGGINYNFVATYFGGTGNDLVLLWANTRPMAWGWNYNGQLGNNSTTESHVPVAVDTTGALAGKTVIATAGGTVHSLALCSDGTLVAWGYNTSGALGNNSTSESDVPVLVDTSGVLAGKAVIAISAGDAHSVALCSDGTVVTWGLNDRGELGNNSVVSQSNVPVLVDTSGVLAGKTVVAISAGGWHTLALCSDGTVAAWGSNVFGELGNNTETDSGVPVAVDRTGALLGRTVIAVAAGDSHNLVLCSDGALVAWGYNGHGQLGNNRIAQSDAPTPVDMSGVLRFKTVVAVAAGHSDCLVLCSDGTLAAWGWNEHGQLGNNSATDSHAPVAVTLTGLVSGKTVVAIAAGGEHNFAQCSDRTLLAWGWNGNGELGNNSITESWVPVESGMSALMSGECFALTANGQGDRHSLGRIASPPFPTVTTLPATSITNSSASLNGSVNANNNSADVSFDYGLTTAYGTHVTGIPTHVTGGTSVAVSADITGLAFSTPYHYRVNGVSPAGTSNGADQTFTTQNPPFIQVEQPAGTALSDGSSSVDFGSVVTGSASPMTFTIRNTGTGDLTGLDIGRDGANSSEFTTSALVTRTLAPGASETFTVTFTPGATTSRSAAIHIVSNDADRSPFDIALTGTGSVLSATFSSPSDVGLTTTSFTPEGSAIGPIALNFAPFTGASLMVVNNTGPGFINGVFSNLAQGQAVALVYHGITYRFVADYFGGTGNDLVLRWANTRLTAWGLNNYGQLGDDSELNRFLPTAVDNTGVLAGKTVAAAAAGDEHSLVLCSDGTLATWGHNNVGQLGFSESNPIPNSLVPVAVDQTGVLAGKTVVAIAAGSYHNLALCSDGTLAAWGWNMIGQLGTGPRMDKYTPAAVDTSGVLSGKTVVAVSAGYLHTLALCSDGTIAAWGYNQDGRLGDGTVADSDFAVAVDMTGVLAGRRVIAVAAGYEYSLALCSDGLVAAWGQNHSGSGPPLVPVAIDQTGVLAGKTVISIAAGGAQSLALCSDGTLATWNEIRSAPAAVDQTGVLAGRTVISIAAGRGHFVAMCSDGTLVAWGDNSSGQLGNSGPGGGPALVDTSSMAAGERFITGTTGQNSSHTLGIVAAPPSVPRIVVEEPAGTALTSHVTNVDFGVVSVGGTSSATTFTIRNTGTADLTGLALSMWGANPSDFTPANLGATTLAGGASTTFTVTFSPGAAGARRASLHIASNDPNQNPFDIPLTGIGRAGGAGKLAFGSNLILVNEEIGILDVPVVRTGGNAGAVTVKVSSANGTATAPADFTALSNVLVNFADGQTSTTVPVTIKMDGLGEPSQTFTLTLSSPTGGATLGTPASTTVRINDFNDVVKPTVTITTPAAGASVPEGAVNVTGSAADNNLVAGVEVSLNGGAFADATTTVAATGLTATYTTPIAPSPGSNTVAVRSRDSRGNVSSIQSRTFSYVVIRPLVVNVSPGGSGTLTAPFPGTDPGRKVGFSYTLTATPKAGNVFNGWTANSTVGTGITPAKAELPTLTFTHQQGLVLTANFITNPFTAAVTGAFNGLITPSSVLPAPTGSLPANETVGMITATVSTTGALSGKLLIDGLTLPFTGVFDNTGAARFGPNRATTFTVVRVTKPSFDLMLELDLTPLPLGTNKLTGTLTQQYRNSTRYVSTLDADRAFYNGTSVKVTSSLAGTSSKAYTMIFPARPSQGPAFTAADYPPGYGYAAARVNINGTVSLTGKLADGTAITASAPLSASNTWPLFNALYSVGGVTQGCLAGQVALDDSQMQTETDMAGTGLYWFRPFQLVQWYPFGWEEGILVDVAGAKYVVPPVTPPRSVFPGPGNPPSALKPVDAAGGNISLAFTDGLLSGPLSLNANVTAANLVTKPTTNADPIFGMTITAASGSFSGYFTHTDTAKTAFQGVIYQKGKARGAYGWFLSTTPAKVDYAGQGGAVSILAK